MRTSSLFFQLNNAKESTTGYLYFAYPNVKDEMHGNLVNKKNTNYKMNGKTGLLGYCEETQF